MLRRTEDFLLAISHPAGSQVLCKAATASCSLLCPSLCSARSSTTTRISTVECALRNPQVTADVARFRTHDATLSVQQQAHRTSHLDMSGSPIKMCTRTVSAATGTACALQRQSATEIQHDHEQIIQHGRHGHQLWPINSRLPVARHNASHHARRRRWASMRRSLRCNCTMAKHETDWLYAACLVTLKTQCAQSTGGLGGDVDSLSLSLTQPFGVGVSLNDTGK